MLAIFVHRPKLLQLAASREDGFEDSAHAILGAHWSDRQGKKSFH